MGTLPGYAYASMVLSFQPKASNITWERLRHNWTSEVKKTFIAPDTHTPAKGCVGGMADPVERRTSRDNYVFARYGKF